MTRITHHNQHILNIICFKPQTPRLGFFVLNEMILNWISGRKYMDE